MGAYPISKPRDHESSRESSCTKRAPIEMVRRFVEKKLIELDGSAFGRCAGELLVSRVAVIWCISMEELVVRQKGLCQVE